MNCPSCRFWRADKEGYVLEDGTPYEGECEISLPPYIVTTPTKRDWTGDSHLTKYDQGCDLGQPKEDDDVV